MRKEEADKTVEIWSTYPPPYGGVSVHSMRLYNILKIKYNIIFKNFNGDVHQPENGIIKVSNQVVEIIKYIFKRGEIIHLHSNRLLVWFIMCFYPRSTQIILTLHNQNLKRKIPFYKKLIINCFFKKVRFIILNDKSYGRYLAERYKLKDNKLLIIPAYIPPLPEESKALPEEIEVFCNKFDKIISTFAWKLYKTDNQDVYGIDQVIDAFSVISDEIESVGLVILIPIIEDKEYYSELLSNIEEYKLTNSILIYDEPISNGFDLWKCSDVFIRATKTDIEGISISEALYFNTPVIATDVIDRPEGVELFHYGDTARLCSLLKDTLKIGKSKSDNKNILDGISQIDKIYSYLLEQN